MPTSSLFQPTDEDDLFDLDEAEFDPESGFDVTCPGCGTRLNDDPAYARFRICPGCARHFWLPARERIELLVDEGSFRESNAELASVDPLTFRDALERSPSSVDSTAFPYGETLITGFARIGGRETEVAVVDFGMLGEDIGVVAGEKLVLAIERAASRRRPLVAVCSGGAVRTGTSMLSQVQAARIASAIGRLHRAGVPFIALLSHPTAGVLFSGFACHASLLFAEPGSQIGSGSQQTIISAVGSTADSALSSGYIDGIVDRRVLHERLVTILDILAARGVPRSAAQVEAASVSPLTAAQEASLALHPARPSSSEYVEKLMPGFVELHGDRSGCECAEVRIGLGQLDGVSLAVIAVDRPNPAIDQDVVAGLRKATRLLRLALLLELPVLMLIDNFDSADGAGGVDAGAATALYYRTVSGVTAPTVAVIIGAANGVQAVAASMADRTLMLEHAVLSPNSQDAPGTAAAPFRQTGVAKYLSSRDCRRLGIVDTVVPEPGDGAHQDQQATAQQLRLAISHALGDLAASGPRRLQDERLRKLRNLGLASPAGTEEVRLEIAHLQDLQRSVGRSIEELRVRLETHSLGLPSLPPLPQRPAMPAMPVTARPNLPSLRKPSIRRPEISDLAERLATTRREFSDKVSDVRSNLAESRPASLLLHPDSDEPSSD